MSSPPVANGRAAVGSTVSTCQARPRASLGGRSRLSASAVTRNVKTRNWIRASVSRASILLPLTTSPLEKPNTTMPGR
jgi:hypothetical protein